ncbi:MAG: type VI secretion system baseplate subunit TssK [Bryobacteraceae bacterium]|nr:type VI secretion system baseplate subunit TssK [Bryobacteraceae bacterium]
MKSLSRVVWSEGMHLGPQHFQAQNRYFESIVQFASEALSYEPWGLSGIQLDQEALKNGVFALVYARGIMPDGLVFLLPESDALPDSRNLGDALSPVEDHTDVYLAIPPAAERGKLVDGGDGSARYSTTGVEMADEWTGGDQQEIKMAGKNFRLLAKHELAGEVALPVARVRRDGSGNYSADSNFIPPLLQIQGNERVLIILRRLVELLEDKSRTVAKPKDLSAGTAAGFSAQGISNAWFLHCVNAGLAPLRHLLSTKSAHPEELYREMARLAGALCTFGIESHPAALPLYNHTDLTEVFANLDHHIRTHLELVVPSNFVSIPLVRRAAYFWEAKITDERVLSHSRWIFAIRSKIGESEILSGTPRLVKLCSKEFLPKLVQRALPGLTMKHLPVAPPAISPRVDFQYFGVDRSGPCWDHLVATRELGLYVPGELPEPDVELLVVLES